MTTLKPFIPVTRAAAIAEFAGTPVEYCDGQIVIVGSAILLFASIGASPGQTRLVAPDRLEWRPARNDYHPDEELPWLPAAAIPRFDHRAELVTRTHVLLRLAGSRDQWIYCGAAHLGSYSYPTEKAPPGPGGPAWYSFDAGRLRRHNWLALGGYPGWEVTVEGSPHYLAADDRAAFSALLRGLRKGEVTHVEITRWEGDAFSVNLNRERGFPMYLRERADSGLYVVWDAQEPWEDERFACGCCGDPLERPRACNTSTRGRTVIADGFLRARRAAQAR